MLGSLVKSKFGLILGSGLLIITIFYLARETYLKRQIDNEVTALQDEIAAIEGKNKEILELINYYKTTEYRERQARSILGLQKPGEFVVALPQKDNPAGDNATPEEPASNLRQWWEYFFSASR